MAVTLKAPFTVTVQVVPATEHGPAQPVNVDPPDAGVAVSVTTWLTANDAVQLAVQLLIPAGLLLTLPDPAPALVTVRELVGAVSNVAVTARDWVMVTVQSPVPLHPSPLQPVKVPPWGGAAVKVTTPLP